MQPGLRSPSHTLTRCLVCGSSEVRTDEVIDRGVVLLAECPRCEHRWTRPVAHAPLRPVAARRADSAVAEVPTAA
jgi:hypothetical protein